MTIPQQRHLFDIPDGIAYFNCAYYAPQLNASRERLLAAVEVKSHPWQRTPRDFFADADAIRVRAAGVFGGDADGYAIVPAASYGLCAAANALQATLAKNDRILVLDEDFPSNYYAWARAARETGARVEVVPKPEAGSNWTAAVLARIARDVRVVAVPHCHWTNGARVDLVAVGRACRDVGAALVVDASQSLGAVPFPLDEIHPDFLIAAGYKWLLSPYGFSLMYVAPQWRNARALEESWLARVGAVDFAALTIYTDSYAPGARRFDVGEVCTAILPGASAALEQLEAWTVQGIADSLAPINRQIAQFLEARGFQLADADSRSPHMIGGVLPASCRADFLGGLRAKGVFISQRGNSLRFSPHLHITGEDIARLFQAIEDTLRAT